MSCELSIIVPCYNTPKHRLRQCMESLEFVGRILPYEVWFIDDGSREDYIVSFVQEYGNPSFHAIRQQNMGCGGARNTGIDLCQGRYITFVDSDDFIYYGPYIEMLKVLKAKQPDILAQGYSFCFEGPATSFMMSYDVHPSCCSYIIRRSLLNELRFTPHIFHEDEEFTTRLHLLRAHLITLNFSAYFYRQEPDSIVHNRNPRHIAKRFEDFLGVMDRLKDLTPPAPHELALRRRLDVMAMCFIVMLMRDCTTGRDISSWIQQLRPRGFYPLPFRWHGMRYLFATIFTMHPLIVRVIAPFVKLYLKIKDASAEKRTFTAYADTADAV